ncbi:MAG: formylglycine-generating enzyme family protein [Byssovorax sp.]
MTPARSITSASSASLGLGLLLLAAPALAGTSTATIDLGGGVTLELVLIPKGSFTQGSPATEKDRKDDERTRSVTLSRDYYLGKYPVTRGQYARFVSVTGYRTEAEKGTSGGSGFDGKDLVQRKEFTWKTPGFAQDDNHPVTLVTWDDARAFNEWLSGVSGREITFPTEAQWEYAYRAGSATAYYGGQTAADALALGWFKENAGNGTRAVGQKKPNRLGLYDMAGNVFEWCADWYAPYAESAATDPLQTVADTSDKARRVLRGGSWLKEARNGRAAARYRNTPGSRNADNGFRVAAGLTVGTPKPPGIPATPLTPATPMTPSTPAGSPSSGGNAAAAVGAGASMLIGGTCCGSVGLFGLIYWFVIRRSGVKGIRFQPGHDGFWIQAPAILAGSTLNYRYTTGSGPLMGNVVLEPSPNGQFVYTGAPPASIEAINLVSNRRPSSQQAYRGGGRSSSSRQRHYSSEPDTSFRGYPPAY